MKLIAAKHQFGLSGAEHSAVVVDFLFEGNTSQADLLRHIKTACEHHAALVDALSYMYSAGFWTNDELPNMTAHQRASVEQACKLLNAIQH